MGAIAAGGLSRLFVSENGLDDGTRRRVREGLPHFRIF